MATVNEGKVVLFGAGGPVGASAITSLKDHYTLRVTDLRPMTEIAAAPPQSPRAPIPEVLGPPHENRVVDITDYAQVLGCLRGHGRGDQCIRRPAAFRAGLPSQHGRRVQRGQSLRGLWNKETDPHGAFSHLAESQRRLLARLPSGS